MKSICQNSALSNSLALNISDDTRGNCAPIRRSILAGERHTVAFNISKVAVNGSSDTCIVQSYVLMQRIPKEMLQMFDMDNTSVHLSLTYLGLTVHTNMQCTSAPGSGLKVAAHEHVTGHKQPLLHKCFPSCSKMLSLCNWVPCCPLGYALALSNNSVLY